MKQFIEKWQKKLSEYDDLGVYNQIDQTMIPTNGEIANLYNNKRSEYDELIKELVSEIKNIDFENSCNNDYKILMNCARDDIEIE